MKTYIIHEMIGNFSRAVYTSDSFYDIQDYLENAWNEAVNNGDYENTEANQELFYSYFHIEEIGA